MTPDEIAEKVKRAEAVVKRSCRCKGSGVVIEYDDGDSYPCDSIGCENRRKLVADVIALAGEVERLRSSVTAEDYEALQADRDEWREQHERLLHIYENQVALWAQGRDQLAAERAKVAELEKKVERFQARPLTHCSGCGEDIGNDCQSLLLGTCGRPACIEVLKITHEEFRAAEKVWSLRKERNAL